MNDNVVDIGSFRIRQQAGRKPWSRNDNRCLHRQLTLDEQGHIVRCETCGETVSAFWALLMLSDEYGRESEKVARAKQSAKEAKDAVLHLTAAKKVEKVWRTRNMAPLCPHCSEAILPEDGLGDRQMSRKFIQARPQQPRPDATET